MVVPLLTDRPLRRIQDKDFAKGKRGGGGGQGGGWGGWGNNQRGHAGFKSLQNSECAPARRA